MQFKVNTATYSLIITTVTYDYTLPPRHDNVSASSSSSDTCRWLDGRAIQIHVHRLFMKKLNAKLLSDGALELLHSSTMVVAF